MCCVVCCGGGVVCVSVLCCRGSVCSFVRLNTFLTLVRKDQRAFETKSCTCDIALNEVNRLKDFKGGTREVILQSLHCISAKIVAPLPSSAVSRDLNNYFPSSADGVERAFIHPGK